MSKPTRIDVARAPWRRRTTLGWTFAPVLALVLAVACGRGPKTTASGRGPSIAANTDRFPHELHTGSNKRIRSYQGRGLICTDCHPKEAVVAGEVARPGKNQHAPCDDCHHDEFYKPPGKFCRVCHETIEPRAQGKTTLQPYPERGFSRTLASDFSHKGHLDAGKMENAVGFHVSCADCHVRDEKSRDPQVPGHKQCARCHTGEKRAKSALAMTKCSGCHPKRNVDLRRGRRFIVGDLIFAHKDHEHDVAGLAIPCQTCHVDIPESEEPGDASVPAMQRCATCHEDSRQTPERVRIARCEVCHTTITSGAAPSNHMMGTGLPEDHTLEFRKNHAEQAENSKSNCRFCHSEVTGAGRDTCFQCHEVMKPRDHDLGWRDDAHGRDAQTDGDRCATCHQADYCSSCHQIPPRSHQPYEEFRLGGHAEAARFDLTSCMACHTNQDTCSNCHRGTR